MKNIEESPCFYILKSVWLSPFKKTFEYCRKNERSKERELVLPYHFPHSWWKENGLFSKSAITLKNKNQEITFCFLFLNVLFISWRVWAKQWFFASQSAETTCYSSELFNSNALCFKILWAVLVETLTFTLHILGYLQITSEIQRWCWRHSNDKKKLFATNTKIIICFQHNNNWLEWWSTNTQR